MLWFERSFRAYAQVERSVKSTRSEAMALSPTKAEDRITGTKGRIVRAALETLKAEGYAGTSARDIARRGGFNQALIFYHFGSVNRLLLAALDHTSAERMERYRAAIADAETLEEMLDVAALTYREDLEGGHMTVVSELMAGSMAHPELKPEIVARIDPWIHLVEEAIRKVMAGSPFEGALPARQVAFAVVAFYCGINTLTNLSRDRPEVADLFRTAGRLGPFLSALLQTPPKRG
jgi:AcrR family transcriptional regulator